MIANRVHKLDPAHLNAIKWYLKQGKPVLFLLGPTNLPGEVPDFDGQSDPLEAMLAELGFKLPKQTILYNIEAREYNERKIGVAFGKADREVDVPGLKFDVETPTGLFEKKKDVRSSSHPHEPHADAPHGGSQGISPGGHPPSAPGLFCAYDLLPADGAAEYRRPARSARHGGAAASRGRLVEASSAEDG